MIRHAAALASFLALAAASLMPISVRAAGADDDKPIKALIVLGGCCHDYKMQKDIIPQGISARANVEWTIAFDPTGATNQLNPIYKNPDWYKGFDVIVHDECSADVKDLDTIDRILKPHRDGLPAVVLHCGMHSYRSAGWPDKDTPWFEFTGLITTAHRAQLPIAVSYVDQDSPITHGLQDWTTVKEELYNNFRTPLPTLHALAKGGQETNNDVCVWTNSYGEKHAKVFGTTLGHNNDTCSDPRYLDLVTRGLLWSVGKLDDKHFKAVKNEKAEAKPTASVLASAVASATPVKASALKATAAAADGKTPGCPCEDDAN